MQELARKLDVKRAGASSPETGPHTCQHLCGYASELYAGVAAAHDHHLGRAALPLQLHEPLLCLPVKPHGG